jgi:hypothetical protein
MSSQKTVTFSPGARSPQSGELWGRGGGLSIIGKSITPAGSYFFGIGEGLSAKTKSSKNKNEIRCQENHDNARNRKSITQHPT